MSGSETCRTPRFVERTRAQECQFVSARSERLDGLGPQRPRLGVRALVVTRITRSTGPQAPLVRNHRVMPRREPVAQRCRVLGPDARAEHCIRIHVTPSLCRRNCNCATCSTAIGQLHSFTTAFSDQHITRYCRPPRFAAGLSSRAPCKCRQPLCGAVPAGSDQWRVGALRAGRAGSVGANGHKRGPHRPPQERVGAIGASTAAAGAGDTGRRDDREHHVNVARDGGERRTARTR